VQSTADTAIALNRFGLGARPDEAPPAQARRALLEQLERYQPRTEAWTALVPSAVLLAASQAAQREQRTLDDVARRQAQEMRRRDAREVHAAGVEARVLSSLVTPAPFVERLVHFWSNHFAVSIEQNAVTALAGAFEAEAIRPHVLGRFEDLLLAVERHPAMLLYLDQARSIGPGSPAGQRANANAQRTGNGQRRGLNENLAREILELHTLGVRSGYGQDDVTEFARALTGWGIAGETPARAARVRGAQNGPPESDETPQAGTFQFQPMQHEPGERRVLGRRYAAGGEAQGLAILRDVAAQPATARHIATKLARHFAGDQPPETLVQRLESVFMRTRGDLPALYRTLVESPEAWAPQPLKFKTPWDWMLSGLRALGRRDLQGVQPVPVMTQLGQPVWRPGSPAGWDDIAASWAAPDALVRRIETAQRLAARAGNAVDPRALAPLVLPGTLTESTRAAVDRAESGASGLALLLVSPDFLRR
jgi:uncharacterized protein (DUF1800 family)